MEAVKYKQLIYIYTHVSPCLEVQNFTSQWEVKKFAKSFARFHIGTYELANEYEI